MSDPVILTIESRVATITLNRPQVGNAIDVPLARALIDAALACEADPAVRCLLLTGSGRLFWAGGDVSLMGAAGSKLPQLLAELIAPLNAAVTRLARIVRPARLGVR